LKSCPVCGTELADGDLFCYRCGRSFTVCRSCGLELPRETAIDARYCPNCGQPLAAFPAAPTVEKEIPWSIGDVFKVLITSFLLDMPLVVLLLFFSLSLRAGTVGMGLAYFSIFSSFHLLLLAFTLHYVRRRKGSLREMGISFITPRFAAIGVGLGVALLALTSLVSFLATPIIGSSPIQEETMRMAKTPEMFAAIFPFASVIAPIIEEVYFRGFSYQAFKKRWGTKGGLPASATFFALLHLDPWVLLEVLIIGILLAYAYEKTRSLPLVIIAHILNNTVALLI